MTPAFSSSEKSASIPAALSPQNSMKSYSDTALPLAVAGEGYGIVGGADGDVGAVGCAEPDGDVEALADDGDGLVVRLPDVHPASAVPASRVATRVAAGARRGWRRIRSPPASVRTPATPVEQGSPAGDGWCRDPAPPRWAQAGCLPPYSGTDRRPRSPEPVGSVGVNIARSVPLFVLAALLEIGGAWLVWQGVREHRGWVWVGAGVVALGLYGFVATLQPDAHFGRILAAYGGVFIAGSLAWGMALDGYRPDRYDVAGALVALAGVAVIMYAPRPS